MTAVELLDKLSEFAERVRGMIWADGWHDLDEIADRLEEELSELDSMRCRLPEEHEELSDGGCCDDEDYAAAMWVREHGGLDAVKERFERVETWDTDKAALWDLCADKAAFWDLRAECGGIDGVRARMMPEGVSWPRFEDGEHVRLGDCYEKSNGNPGTVTAMQLRLYGDVPTWVIGKGKGKVSVKPGKRVKRPAPKVLDADGVEIREGDTVYLLPGGWCDEFPCLGYHGGEKLEVFSLHAAHVEGGIGCRETRRPLGGCCPQPSQLTHRAPVLAADGRPLREGETVWKVKNGDGPYHVQEIRDGVSVCVEETSCEFMPKELTHERPDSWERLEGDCAMFASDYAEKHCLEKDGSGWGVPMRRDLVRRAKKLAGIS